MKKPEKGRVTALGGAVVPDAAEDPAFAFLFRAIFDLEQKLKPPADEPFPRGFAHLQIQPEVVRFPCQRDIVGRQNPTDELAFAAKRGVLVPADLPFHGARAFKHDEEMLALGAGFEGPITGYPFSEIQRFSDVKRAISRIEEEIDPRAAGRSHQGFPAQAGVEGIAIRA